MLDELADLLDTAIYGEIESKEDLLEEARRGEQSPTCYIAGEVPVEVGERTLSGDGFIERII